MKYINFTFKDGLVRDSGLFWMRVQSTKYIKLNRYLHCSMWERLDEFKVHKGRLESEGNQPDAHSAFREAIHYLG